MSLVLRIPRRLETPNIWNGRHWRVKHRISQEWEAEITYLEWVAVSHRRMPVDAPVRMCVSIERVVPSARNFIRDDDNLRFSVKPLLDALKRQGYIHNDSRKWLEHPTPTQRVSDDGKDWTIITIERSVDEAIQMVQAMKGGYVCQACEHTRDDHGGIGPCSICGCRGYINGLSEAIAEQALKG